MSFTTNNPVKSQELALYEIPDKRKINHCDSLPREIAFKIFNFVLSGKGEAPSPKALGRLCHLNLKTNYRLSFISKTFKHWLDQYYDASGVKQASVNLFGVRTLHYDMQLAKETISYWKELKGLQLDLDQDSKKAHEEQEKRVDNGIMAASLLYVNGLVSYEEVIGLIESRPQECRAALYHHLYHVFFKSSLFPQILRLMEEGRLTESQVRLFKADILFNWQLLDDDLDKNVIDFIDNEIKNGNLEQIICSTSHLSNRFDHFVDYSINKNIFYNNENLIKYFILKTTNVERKNRLINTFFVDFIKKRDFDKALEFGKKIGMQPCLMAVYLIQEEQYQLVFDLYKNLDNNEINTLISHLLEYDDIEEEKGVFFLSLLLNPYEETTDGIARSASILRKKLNPLQLDVILEFFALDDVIDTDLLGYQAWDIHSIDEKKFVDLLTKEGISMKALVFLVKSMKREFDPCQFLSCILEREKRERRKRKGLVFPSQFLIHAYLILCDIRLNPLRKQALRALLPAFLNRPLFIQELEKISPDYADLIEEIRAQKNSKCVIV